MIISVMMGSYPVYAADNISAMDKCIQTEALAAGISETIGEIEKRCRKKIADSDMKTGETILERRMRLTEQAFGNPFVISAYKPSYILLFAHNEESNEAPFSLQFPDEDTSLDNTEVKFQISAKFPLFVDLFDGKGNVFFAYTNRSFWQLYNDNSAPFRETNHEPEIFLSLKNDWKLFGLTNRLVNVGFVHQSNGRGGTLSRSWNRIYASFVFEKDNFVMDFKPWFRISEDEADDDNPDIEDYMGNFELTGIYKKGRNTFSVMLRNNLDSDDNRGAIQVDWVFPLFKHLSGYVQYFSGYGESMIDYNYDQESIGIGLALSGWL
jgi:phospholipase A1